MALEMLRKRGLLEPDRLKLMPGVDIETPLVIKCDEFVEALEPVIGYVLSLHNEFGLYGEGGLKDRSSLMTFKYDVKSNASVN